MSARSPRVAGDTGEAIETAGLQCIGESDIGGSDLLGTLAGDERDDRDEAIEFLAAELENGAQSAGVIKAAATKAGIGPSPLKRAKRALGVKSEKGGMDAGWWWELPEGDAPKGTALPSIKPSPSSPSAFQAVSDPPEGDEIPEGDGYSDATPSEDDGAPGALVWDFTGDGGERSKPTPDEGDPDYPPKPKTRKPTAEQMRTWEANGDKGAGR